MVFDVRILAPVAGAIGFLSSILLFVLLTRTPRTDNSGSEKMRSIAQEIRSGAMTFLKAQLARVGIFILIVGTIVGFVFGPWLSLTFVLGAVASILIGWFGLMVSTRANFRTAEAARTSGRRAALRVSLNSAASIGLFISSIGLIFLGAIFYFFEAAHGHFTMMVAGFSLGASSIALFSRLGGGIFATAADMGSDMAGKVESGIPEDDARNPGVIADQVGDNVSGIAGMSADIFESFVGAMVAAVILASYLSAKVIQTQFGGVDENLLVGLPLFLGTIGLAASLFAILVANFLGRYSSSRVVLVIEILALIGFLGTTAALLISGGYTLNIFYAVAIGTVGGFLIGKTIYIYMTTRPSWQVAEAGKSGPVTNFMSGLAAGFESATLPLLILAIAIIASYLCGGLFGISLTSIGMLATVATTIALDAYGPIADNASGIAEMASLDSEVRKITGELDDLGNRTATVGKGFSVAAAAMTSVTFFIAFQEALRSKGSVTGNLSDPKCLAGIFIGALIVLFISSAIMKSVARAAVKVVAEIRRQFREIPGLLNGTGTPDNNRCTEISAEAALKEMNIPVIVAVAAPIVVGKLLGPEALGGFLVGSIVTGVAIGLFMTNSGGIWAAARKRIESGEMAGERRGSKTHQAAMLGDSVGDPLKDTAGPALNILIKLMAIISFLIVPLI